MYFSFDRDFGEGTRIQKSQEGQETWQSSAASKRESSQLFSHLSAASDLGGDEAESGR